MICLIPTVHFCSHPMTRPGTRRKSQSHIWTAACPPATITSTLTIYRKAAYSATPKRRGICQFCRCSSPQAPGISLHHQCSTALFHCHQGSNLFETLVHLMLPVDEIDDFDSVPVVLAVQQASRSQKAVAHTSWLYGMLFPARRVLLIPEADGVREIYYSQGENFCEPGNWTDPHVTYRFGKTGRFPMASQRCKSRMAKLERPHQH